MGLDLNTALISDTFDGLIKTTDANVLTSSPLVLTDGRGNNSSLALATAGNGVAITGGLTVDGTNISTDLSQAQADIIAIETKTDFITVSTAVNLNNIKTKTDFITVTQAVDLDTIESQAAAASAKTAFITVTQAVDLDTMESDILSAKTKTDFITIGQAVNLDNIKSGLATAEADIIAIEAKTDFITISSALNLNTVASNASAAKTKTDFITITQAVNLDTLESDVNVAQGDITAIEAKTDFITISSALNLNTVASNAADAKSKTDFITITQAVNLDTVESDVNQAKTDINLIEGKTDFITVTQAVNLDTMESDIATNNAKNSYPSGDATKVGFISVTQAVNLDSMETDITNLSANKYDKTGGTISGAVTITGDLTVNGTTTTVNTQTLSVKDPLIELANDNDANSVDTGFYANYSEDAGVTTKYAGLFRDAGDSDKFKLFKGLEVEPTTTVNTAGTGYAKGDLVVNDLDAVTLSGTLSATSVLANGVIATTQATSDNSTKVATTAFVKSVVTAEDLDIAGDSGTGAVDLDSQVLTIAGTANEIETSASGQTITIGLPSTITANVTGNVSGNLTGTVLTAAQTNITSVGTLSSLTVAGALNGTISTAAQPNITSVGTLTGLTVSGDVSIADKIIHTGDTNTAIRFPALDTVTVETNGNERLRVDSSGNVGIGTTPFDWGSGFLGVDLGGSTAGNIGGTSRTRLSTNLYFDGTNQKYKTGFGSVAYFQDAVNITHNWYTAPTGSAGETATITERMRIDSSGNVGIGTSSPAANLHIESSTGGVVRISSSDTSVDGGSLGKLEFFSNDASAGASGVKGEIACVDNTGFGQSYDLIFKTGRSSGGVNVLEEAARFSSAKNLVFPNGQGIDFSASAGGGATSSLLDDYEEGTWTPVWNFSTSGSVTPNFLNTTYTKVGRKVTVTATLRTTSVSSPSGDATITGLPFVVSGGGAVAIGGIFRWATDMPNINAEVGASSIFFYKSATDSASLTPLAGSDFNAGSNQNIMVITATYFV